MDLVEAIKTRRSIRKFKEEKISDELLEKIIAATIYSPSWKNTQIVRYVAIEDEIIKKKIAMEYVPDYNQKAILSAPMLLAITIVKSRSGYERDGSFSTIKGNGWEMFDCGIASQTLCLASHGYGLGTVIIGLFDNNAITEILNVPKEQELVTLIAIGYPDEMPVMPKRKVVNDILQYL